jgi:hypothetical protein
MIKNKLMDMAVASLAIAAGAIIIYLGDRLLGVRLEYYSGIETFNTSWALDVFGVTFVAGVVVSLIYGLGGKILAHLSPVLVRVISYYEVHHGLVPPEGASILPIGFWLLVVVLSAEFAALGGVVGEVIVKKTYGRTANKALLHKKHQRKHAAGSKLHETLSPKRPVEGTDQ